MPKGEWSDKTPATADRSVGSGSLPPRDFRQESMGTEQTTAAQASRQRDAEGLLVELYAATRGLGDALNRAGFPPGRWDTPEARLSTLGNRLPQVTVEALLARLADFALDTGPIWLAGTGEALDEFAHEVHVLAAAIGPLRGLAQQQRTLASVADRSRRSLKQALQDERVDAELDRLAHTLRQLQELAAALEPIASLPRGVPSMQASGVVVSRRARGEQEGNAAVPVWLVGQTGQEQAPDMSPHPRKVSRWPGSQLLRAAWSRRGTRVALGVGSVVLLVVLAMSGALALVHALTAPVPGPASRDQGAPTATHSGSATPSAGRTATVVPATQGPAAAVLAVSPASLVLPCGGTPVTLTVSNTGGQSLMWQASVSGNAALSATSGSVGPASQATVSVHATGTQHGPGAIVFTSNGRTAKVTFKVSCH
jgi:hypothetical protein